MILSPFRSQNPEGRRNRSQSFMKRWRIILLFFPACVSAGYITVFGGQISHGVAQGVVSSRDIIGEDRKFLDDLFQKLNQENRPGWEASLHPKENSGDAGTMESPPGTLLVVKSEVVRRAELVVPREKVKRKYRLADNVRDGK